MLKYPNAAARANDYDLAERSSSAERLRLSERNAYDLAEPFFAEPFFAECFFAGFRWPVFALYSL